MYTFMYQFSPLYTKYEKKYVSNLNQFDFQLRAMIGSTSPRGMKSGERTCNRPISFWIIKRHRYSYEYEDTAATLHWSALYFSASSTKHFLAVTNSKPRARSKSTVGQQPHLHCFFSAATLSRIPKKYLCGRTQRHFLRFSFFLTDIFLALFELRMSDCYPILLFMQT